MNESIFLLRIENLTNRLYRVCRTILKSDADCQDAVQNAIFRAWRYLPTLRSDDAFEGWLIRITINECKKLIRSTRPTAPLEENVPSAEESSRLWEIIHAMDEKYRIPVELYYVENYSIRQIAHILRVPEGTVKRRLHTARKLVKEGFL